jgi:membrane protease YdiL (CAAX protease family)
VVFDPAPAEQPVPLAAPPPILPVQRIGALIEVLLCSGFPTQLFLIVVMTSAGMQLQKSDGQWSLLFVLTLSLLDTALVLGFVWFFLRAHGERARDVLLGDRPVRLEVIAGFALLPLVFVLSLLMLGVIFVIAPDLHNVPRNPLESMMQNRQQAVIFGVVAMIAGGVREEIQRGFILHRFREYLGGGAVGVVVHSTLFGLGHVDQGWDAALTVAMLGAIWGTIYLTRRSIIAPLVSHAGFNLAQVVKFFVVLK